MSIELPDFPKVSQLTTTTGDGKPSNNAEWDCVPASIGMMMLYYKHLRQWTTEIDPDRLKDAAYGPTYANEGTYAGNYAAICKQLGFYLWSVTTTSPADVVAQGHIQLNQKKRPVLITELDPYDRAPGLSHVVVWYSDEPHGQSLTAMDPYIGEPVTYDDSQWVERLRSNQYWLLTPLLTHEPVLPTPFEKELQALWDMGVPGLPTNTGIAQAWRAAQWDSTHTTLKRYFGAPRSAEIALSIDGDPCSIQPFETVLAIWNHLTHTCTWVDSRGPFLDLPASTS
jgi:hypothetical protein